MSESFVLLHPTHNNSGLFAYLWQTIRGIYHNPNKNYYFYFGPECCYYDSEISGFNNAWDYYFEQPHTATPPENIEKEVGVIYDHESEFREGTEFNLKFMEYNKRRFIFHEIINKYYKLKPHIEKKIQAFYDAHFLNKKVLGIHCRGTDHPNNIDIQQFISQIKEISVSYDLIFAMSDEQSKIDILQKHFGEKVITYDTFRSTDGSPIHIALRHLHNPRLIGEEAIIETYLISKTDLLLLYTGSNVNFYARALNPNLPYINLNSRANFL